MMTSPFEWIASSWAFRLNQPPLMMRDAPAFSAFMDSVALSEVTGSCQPPSCGRLCGFGPPFRCRVALVTVSVAALD